MYRARRWWPPVLLGAIVLTLAVGMADVLGLTPSRTIDGPRIPSASATPGAAEIELREPPTAAAPRPVVRRAVAPLPVVRPPQAQPPRHRREHRRHRQPHHRRRPVHAPTPADFARPMAMPAATAVPAATPTPVPTLGPTPIPTPAVPPPCVPEPPVAGGSVSVLADRRITESSGLAMAGPDLAYTINDENGPVFVIRPSTGATVRTIDPPGHLEDPEAVAVDSQGRLWVGDTGDGHPPGDPARRRHVTITVDGERFAIRYPSGPVNAEALLVHPITGAAYVISKARVGRLYALPQPMAPGLATDTGHRLPAFVTDAAFTRDGRFALMRTMTQPELLVFDASTWTQVGALPAPPMAQGESLAVEPDGRSVLIGSEGVHSPLIRVPLPTAFAPPPVCVATSAPPPPPKPEPEQPARIDLSQWKLTLPTGREGQPDEILAPDLGPGPLTFRAAPSGVTTENSHYPRAELREMNGPREAAWSSRVGTHTMTITQAITAVPHAKPQVVAGQIHDARDDVVMVRLEGHRLFVESDGREAGLLDAQYRLGTQFTVELAATPRGIRVTYNGSRVVELPVVGRGWYFKAGCYPQANRGGGYGEVVIYALRVQATRGSTLGVVER